MRSGSRSVCGLGWCDMILVEQSASLEAITPDALALIERAGRTCYRSEDRIGPGTAEAFVAMIRRRGHLSVLEHAVATLRLVTDRGVSHEMVRHRIASFSQESTRYCNYGRSAVAFVRPVKADGSPAFVDYAHTRWEHAMLVAEAMYLDLLEAGATPQDARSVLPNSLKTEIVITANFREWLHIFDLRTAPAAHPQMRHLMGLARAVLAAEAPTIFGGFS